MKLKKWVGLLLAGLMLAVSLTGCLGHVFTKAMTIEGVDVTAGEYLMMQLVSYSDGMALVEDTTTDLLEQQIEDQDATDWIHDKTEDYCRRMVAVELICAERGIELSEENVAQLESDMEYWPSVKEYYEPNGIGQESLRRYLRWQYLEQQLFTSIYSEGGELAPSRDEVAAYYSESNAHLRMMIISLLDYATYMEVENSDEVREAIDAMVEEMKAGKSISDAAREDLPAIEAMVNPVVEDEEESPEEEGLEEEAEEQAEETGEEEEEEAAEVDGIINYYLNYTNDATGYFTEDFIAELQTQSVGDVGTYDLDETTVLVYEVIETFEKDSEYESVRESVVREMMADPFEAYLKDIYSTYTVEWVPLVQWYLSPKNIVR